MTSRNPSSDTAPTPAKHEQVDFTSADGLTLPASGQWLDYLACARSDDGRIYRSQIDPPLDRPGLMDRILWVEVLPGPRYFYRVVGESVQARVGVRLVGHHLDELDLAGFEEMLIDLYARVTAGETLHMRGLYARDDSMVCNWEATLTAIYGADAPTHIMVGMAYAD